MLKLTYAIFAISLILISCDSKKESPLLNEKLNDRNLFEIGKKISEDKLIDMFQLRYYQRGVINFVLNKESIKDKTVGDIINMQMEKEKEIITNDLLTASKNLEFNLNLGFKLARLSPVDNEESKMNVVTYQFFNNSEQDIKQVKGMVKLLSRNDNTLIKQFPVDITDVIPVGKGLEKNMPYLHDDANQRDQIIRNPQALLKFEWHPELVVFADESKIEREVPKEDTK
jgi:hypothetical protein